MLSFDADTLEISWIRWTQALQRKPSVECLSLKAEHWEKLTPEEFGCKACWVQFVFCRAWSNLSIGVNTNAGQSRTVDSRCKSKKCERVTFCILFFSVSRLLTFDLSKFHCPMQSELLGRGSGMPQQEFGRNSSVWKKWLPLSAKVLETWNMCH